MNTRTPSPSPAAAAPVAAADGATATQAAPATHTAFAGSRCLAHGPLAEVLGTLKARFDRQSDEAVVVLELQTGRPVDFDLRGSLDEVLARALPAAAGATASAAGVAAAAGSAAAPRAAGRPKLGVTAREITLLPRHWQWLEQQQAGVSGALRRLVEEAIRNEPPAARAAARRAALGRMLTTLAGERPQYEEACRALYAGDTPRLLEQVQKWPKDLRELVTTLAQQAQAIEDGA